MRCNAPATRARSTCSSKTRHGFARPCGVGFPMQHPERASVALGVFNEKGPGGERKQIRGNRLGFGVPRWTWSSSRHRVAAPRHSQCACHAGGTSSSSVNRRLQIRLIEAGKREVRPGRHEKRVHEIGRPVQRQVAAGERQAHFVGAGAEHRRGNDEVLVAHLRLERARQRARVADAVGRSGKIERPPGCSHPRP